MFLKIFFLRGEKTLFQWLLSCFLCEMGSSLMLLGEFYILFGFLTWKCSYLIVIDVLICMTQKFYFVCSAYEQYEISSNCMAITICSIYLLEIWNLYVANEESDYGFLIFSRVFLDKFANINVIFFFKVGSV